MVARLLKLFPLQQLPPILATSTFPPSTFPRLHPLDSHVVPPPIDIASRGPSLRIAAPIHSPPSPLWARPPFSRGRDVDTPSLFLLSRLLPTFRRLFTYRPFRLHSSLGLPFLFPPLPFFKSIATLSQKKRRQVCNEKVLLAQPTISLLHVPSLSRFCLSPLLAHPLASPPPQTLSAFLDDTLLSLFRGGLSSFALFVSPRLFSHDEVDPMSPASKERRSLKAASSSRNLESSLRHLRPPP